MVAEEGLDLPRNSTLRLFFEKPCSEPLTTVLALA